MMIYLQLVYALKIVRPKDSAKMVGVYMTIIKFIREQFPQHFNLNS